LSPPHFSPLRRLRHLGFDARHVPPKTLYGPLLARLWRRRCLWLWLGHPLAALACVIYFLFVDDVMLAKKPTKRRRHKASSRNNSPRTAWYRVRSLVSDALLFCFLRGSARSINLYKRYLFSVDILETFVPSVLWHSWLGVRKSIRPVKIE